MSDYDAFGRKAGEDPLAELKQEQAAAAGSAPPPPSSPSSGLRAVPLGVAALVLVVLGVAGAALALISSDGRPEPEQAPAVVTDGSRPASQPQSAPESEPESAPQPTAQAPARKPKKPRGLEPGSLIRRDELGRAVARLRGADLGAPVSIRVAAERIDAQLKGGGKLRSVQIAAGGDLQEQYATPGFDAVPAMTWADVRPSAPERLVRAAAERLGRPATHVDYLVLMTLPDPTWGVFFRGGGHFQGDAAGRITRRVS